MKIKCITRHGIMAEIHLTTGENFGIHNNEFHIKDGASGDCPLTFGFHKTLDEMENKFNDVVDSWYQTIPHTDDEWIDKLTECMNWTGYESCHISKKQALRVLGMASKHYKVDTQ